MANSIFLGRLNAEQRKALIERLWHAWKYGLMTPAEISSFISEVRAKGSKLPEVDIEKYACKTVL